MTYHITQRGNRRQPTVCCAEDYQEYVTLMGEWCRACAVKVWADCLMPNPVHLIAVPDSAAAWRRAIGEVHRRDPRRVTIREGWRGQFWHGRFAACPMDEM